jgi:hypothetical protein
MSKRRSLDDALSPEARAFLDGGSTPPNEPAKPERLEKLVEQAPAAIPSESAPQPRPDSRKLNSTAKAALPAAEAGLASLNHKIDQRISAALHRASTERRIQRQEPFWEKDIVSEALAEWLKSHGHL